MEKNSFMALRRLHGAIYEWNLARKQKWFDDHIIEIGQRISLKNAESRPTASEDYPVDVVVTWVDGSDPEWLKEKAIYRGREESFQENLERYREWGTFRYWFRAIEQYAPWVNKIFLVTCGQVPGWLDLDNPKLQVVFHKDFIPEKYLPTFSSHAIEINLWRIKDLSEHFLYFNDDVFLNRSVQKNDFFRFGEPKYCACAKPIAVYDNNICEFYHAQLNNAAIINTFFQAKKVVSEHPEKWFSFRYNANNEIKYNIRLRDEGYFVGNFYAHLGVPYRKSTMEKVCSLIPEWVVRTSSNRFRTSDDIMHQIFQLWEIFEGTFEPVEMDYYGIARNVSIESIDFLEKEILSKNNRMICLNDWEGISDEDFPTLKARLLNCLDQILPMKSSYEN